MKEVRSHASLVPQVNHICQRSVQQHQTLNVRHVIKQHAMRACHGRQVRLAMLPKMVQIALHVSLTIALQASLGILTVARTDQVVKLIDLVPRGSGREGRLHQIVFVKHGENLERTVTTIKTVTRETGTINMYGLKVMVMMVTNTLI